MSKYEELLIEEYNRGYNQGLQDAWELARKLYCEKNTYDLIEIFGIEYKNYSGSTIYAKVLKCLTPQEALAKIEAYEESKVINVGDVVEIESDEREWLGVVIGIYAGDNYYVLEKDGEIQIWDAEHLKKTGRTVDIQHILEQIRGNE